MAPTQRHRWLTLPGPASASGPPTCAGSPSISARADFEQRYPRVRFGPVVAVIAAYQEEQNIGDVLKAMPTLVGDLEVTTLVVVDGGTDNTAGVAIDAGVYTCVLPVNLGHGAALKLGYQLASALGARYVVTLDADGQNDPAELGTMLQPLLDDTADFVIASRRLGVDQTTDRLRQAGVKVYAWILNAIVGPAAHRLVQRLPGLQDRGARRHRPPPGRGPVPDGGGGDHRGQLGAGGSPSSRRSGTPGRRGPRRRAAIWSSACSTAGSSGPPGCG